MGSSSLVLSEVGSMIREIFLLWVNFMLISSVIVEAFPKSQGFKGKFLTDYLKEGYGQPVVAYQVPENEGNVNKRYFSGAGMYKNKRLAPGARLMMFTGLKKRGDPNAEGYLGSLDNEFY